ncbi:MAG: hypothetical protein IKZ13_04170 [Akkermansia sp.]|nr:hypothetical protein [Akkermansia sp.]
MVRYFILMLLMILVSIILIVLHRKYLRRTAPAILPDSTNTPVNKKWMIAVCCLSAIIYTGLAFLLSMSWLQGDDFLFPPLSEHFPINAKIGAICYRYSQWVSRLGEQLIVIFGVSDNRWQQFIITPAAITVIPYALHRLLRPEGESIFSSKGFLFILLSTSLLLLCGIFWGGEWRNFRCAAASANYLWPLAPIAFFLACYRGDFIRKAHNSKWAVPGLFILGLCCGWFIECITILLVPGLIIWAAIRLYKKLYIPTQCYSGILGAMWGMFMLFGSPALSKRAEGVRAALESDFSAMSFADAFEFVSHLTPEKMQMLQGGAIRAVIGVFPLPLRAFFLPELMKYYLPYCAAALVTCALLMLLTSFTAERRKLLTMASVGVLLSLLSAASYLGGGIPFDMSFLPPAFILIATTGFLFLHGRLHSIIKITLPLVAGIIVLSYLVPAGIEAWEYLPAREARTQLIYQKIAAGEKNISLPPPYCKAPKDRLGLLNRGSLGTNPDVYPNSPARAYFNVENITQEAVPEIND